MTWVQTIISEARAERGPGDLVPGRPGVADSVIEADLAALVGARATPAVEAPRDRAITLALVRAVLGLGVIVPQVGPWETGTPPDGTLALVLLDEPARNGRDRSIAPAFYRDATGWSAGLGEPPFTPVAWLVLDDENTFFESLIGDLYPAGWFG